MPRDLRIRVSAGLLTLLDRATTTLGYDHVADTVRHFVVEGLKRLPQRSRNFGQRTPQRSRNFVHNAASLRGDYRGVVTSKSLTSRMKLTTVAEKEHTNTRKHEQTSKSDTKKPISSITYSPAFMQFWVQYPRPVGKYRAFQVWNRIKPDPDLIAQIATALDAAKICEQWTRDGDQFIPHPATWLNRRGWEDEYAPAPREPLPPYLSPLPTRVAP